MTPPPTRSPVKASGISRSLFLCARQGGRIHQEVQVLYRPDRGNCQPDDKGVHREVESEGSRRQRAGLTKKNRNGGTVSV